VVFFVFFWDWFVLSWFSFPRVVFAPVTTVVYILHHVLAYGYLAPTRPPHNITYYPLSHLHRNSW
jgi:hypothetical protein